MVVPLRESGCEAEVLGEIGEDAAPAAGHGPQVLVLVKVRVNRTKQPAYS